MPVLPGGDYVPPLPLRNKHFHTVYPAIFRRIEGITYQRERIDLPDEDFLDLDWSFVSSADSPKEQLCVFLHGLEGNTDRSYIKGMVRAFNRAGWDALAVNFRGCSGETNRLLRFYHAGATEDLQAVIDHIHQHHNYSRLILVGFSLGGNLLLKYLGDMGTQVDSKICGAMGISVPCDLAASCIEIAHHTNDFYMRRFMRLLRVKMKAKAELHPGALDLSKLDEITTFHEFDNLYTAPLHGFESAKAYWHNCSCKWGLPNIRIPTLILNAEDDPFLPASCYPIKEANENPHLHVEVPRYGGHLGFVDWRRDRKYWSERRALAFFSSILALETGGY